MMSSSSLNDGKAAIPLLKGIQEKLSPLTIRYGRMDAGFDFLPIYQQLLSMKAYGIIAKRNEGEIFGFDENFAPTCLREHSYRYESYDFV